MKHWLIHVHTKYTSKVDGASIYLWVEADNPKSAIESARKYPDAYEVSIAKIAMNFNPLETLNSFEKWKEPK